jgi:hypothetical protein
VALSSVTSGTTSSSYSWSGISLGAEASNREIVVVVSSRGVTSGTTPTATIVGSAMTRDVVGWRISGGEGVQVAVFRLAVPTGSTATFSVTFNDSATSAAATFYRMVGRVAAPSLTSTGSVDGQISESVSVPSGGAAVIGFVTTNAGTAGHTWSGATEVFDSATASATHSSAIKTGATGTVVATKSSNSDGSALAAAGYGP